MDFELGQEAGSLRHHLRELIARHLPTDFLGAFTDDPEDLETTKRFCKVLAAEGLLALAWPTEYGGAGASVWEQTVLREEMWAHYEPRGPQYMGLNWIGPAIMRFGTAPKGPPPAAYRRRARPSGARGSPSLTPEVTWLRCVPWPERWTTAGGSPGRRSGPRTRRWRSGASWPPGRARPSRGAGGSRSSSCQWTDRASRCARSASLLGPYHLNEVFFDDVPVARHEFLGRKTRGGR